MRNKTDTLTTQNIPAVYWKIKKRGSINGNSCVFTLNQATVQGLNLRDTNSDCDIGVYHSVTS